MAEAKTINWEEALNQVGGDEEFLDEVLSDLLNESDTAETDIGKALAEKNFDGVMKAAHRIKGSASYLCCEKLRDVSFQLQNLGHSGIGLADEAAIENLFVEISKLYDTFKENLVELRAAIAAKLAK
jgi:HPt (histidine-containing phosphotransfer) domain-containing protein